VHQTPQHHPKQVPKEKQPKPYRVVDTSKIDPDEPFILQLEHAFEGTTGLITELKFRPIDADALWDVPTDGAKHVGMIFEVAAKQTGLTPMDLRKLKGQDIKNVLRVVAVFMEPYQETS
jgi:hypothetical protein